MIECYTAKDFTNEHNLPLPLALVASEKYRDVSDSEAILYAVLKYRMRLSARRPQDFQDDDGCFVYYRQEELAAMLNKSVRQIKALFSALVKHGLIITRKQGIGMPQKIYLVKLEAAEVQNSAPQEVQENVPPRCEKLPPRGEENCTSEVKKTAPLYSREIRDRDKRENREDSSCRTTAPKRQQPFKPPTLDELKAYMAEKGYTFDAEAFIAYYESNGWMVGRNHMKSWRGACVTWQKKEKPRGRPAFPLPSQDPEERQRKFEEQAKYGWNVPGDERGGNGYGR